MRYKIIVRTLSGSILTFSVNHYDIVDSMVVFTDEKTGDAKLYPSNNCEITGGGK